MEAPHPEGYGRMNCLSRGRGGRSVTPRRPCLHGGHNHRLLEVQRPPAPSLLPLRTTSTAKQANELLLRRDELCYELLVANHQSNSEESYSSSLHISCGTIKGGSGCASWGPDLSLGDRVSLQQALRHCGCRMTGRQGRVKPQRKAVDGCFGRRLDAEFTYVGSGAAGRGTPKVLLVLSLIDPPCLCLRHERRREEEGSSVLA